MPWVIRDSRRPHHRLRQAVRRWKYDHSQHLLSMRIGVAVVVFTAAVVVALRLVA
jgi:hypothetical protein